MNPHLRHAVTSDLDAILALERAADQAPHWAPAAYEAILDSTDLRRCMIVAYANEALTGFAVGLMALTATDSAECIAELESVVVAADARRAGIGRALCTAVFDWCRSQDATQIVLEVRAASSGAIALYTRLGFTRTGSRPRYYHDPEDDALIMRLELNPTDLLKKTDCGELPSNYSATPGIEGLSFNPKSRFLP